jgi:hypothetical protein
MTNSLNSKLFEKGEVISRESSKNVLGGASSNKSDKEGGPTDTHKDGSSSGTGWDIAYQSVLDIKETSTTNDKPSQSMI